MTGFVLYEVTNQLREIQVGGPWTDEAEAKQKAVETGGRHGQVFYERLDNSFERLNWEEPRPPK